MFLFLQALFTVSLAVIYNFPDANVTINVAQTGTITWQASVADACHILI